MTAPDAEETLDMQAAAWFARQRAGDMGAEETAALADWLAQDPARREALERLERTWAGVESARGDPRIMIMRERALKRPTRPARVSAFRAMAAGLAAVVVAGGLLGVWQLAPKQGYGSLPTQTYRTGVGQQATVTLSDGSVVTLNTDTRLRTRSVKGRRLVHLDQGQAYFRVAKDPLHPFVVSAAGRTVTAVGTAFDVRVEKDRFEVTVVEGKVRVNAPPPAAPRLKAAPAKPLDGAEMTAGSQLVSLPRTGAWTMKQADPAREVSWLRGYVVFQNAPFGEVAGEMNRYTDRKIVVDDPELARTLVSGAFRAGDIDAFVTAFESYKVARVRSRDDGAVRLEQF